MPDIKYLFITTEGRASVPDRSYLESPLVLTLEENHSSLTLKDYFAAMERFLLSENGEPFCKAVAAVAGAPVDPNLSVGDIDSVVLCSVKIGAYYHIAKVDVFLRPHEVSLALSASFTPVGRRCLKKDYQTLSAMQNRAAGAFLPAPFFCGEVVVKDQPFFMVLSNWLDGFHEWHFTNATGTEEPGIVLWDGHRDHIVLDPEQEKELFFKVAYLLTLCFEPSTAKQVCKWHHAAGDFIAGIGSGGGVEVRLTTIRSYRPVFEQEGNIGGMLGLLFFFLDLTVRIRLDRLDGIGEAYWVNSRFLEDTVQGFFHGLRMLGAEDEIDSDEIGEFYALLCSMSSEELYAVLVPLLDVYEHENSADMDLITKNLEEHAENLYKVLKEFDFKTA